MSRPVCSAVALSIAVVACSSSKGPSKRSERDVLLDVNGHIVVLTRLTPLRDHQRVVEIAIADEAVIDAAPFQFGEVFVGKTIGEKQNPAVLKGVATDRQPAREIARYVVSGRMVAASGEAVIGDQLAAALGVTVGGTMIVKAVAPPPYALDDDVLDDDIDYADDEVVDPAPPDMRVPASDDPEDPVVAAAPERTVELEDRPTQVSIVGILRTTFDEYDRNLVIVPLATSQTITARAEPMGIEIRTRDPKNAIEAAKRLGKTLGPEEFEVIDWCELNRAFWKTIGVSC
jgi:ABC-type lipoprotein release transport system permease subunit